MPGFSLARNLARVRIDEIEPMLPKRSRIESTPSSDAAAIIPPYRLPTGSLWLRGKKKKSTEFSARFIGVFIRNRLYGLFDNIEIGACFGPDTESNRSLIDADSGLPASNWDTTEFLATFFR